MTNSFFYNTVQRQTATKQPLLAEVYNKYCWSVARAPRWKYWKRL